MKKVWLVATENGAFPGGKIGGVGDVIRDLPIALVASGLNARVITPSYGMFHKLPGTTLYRRLTVRFAGKQFIVKIFKVPVEGTSGSPLCDRTRPVVAPWTRAHLCR